MNPIMLFLLPSLLGIITLPMIPKRRMAARWSACLTVVSFIFAVRLATEVYRGQHSVFWAQQWLFCDVFGAFYILFCSFIASCRNAS